MANRFLNNIKINDSYTLPAADGTADQVITTDGSGQLSFVDQSAINAGNAERVVIYAKNTSGASISKGTPVHITGTVGATDTVEIAPADAGNSAKMPAVGLLDDTLANNAFGYVITGGFMDNITTDPIDGATPSSNDTVYVKAGGGLTLTKPTGSNLIQNVAKVGKVSGGNAGSLIVSSILRTNDVPNLTTGKIWVGSAANTIESATVHLDEANGRMGIGTANPGYKLHVNGGGLQTTTATGNKISYYDGNGIGAYSSGGYFLSNYYDDLILQNNADDRDIIFKASAGTASPTEIMRIDGSSGNVGIGTTSPIGRLNIVNGSSGQTYSNISGLLIDVNGTSNSYYGLRVGSSTGNDHLSVTNAGNVGIGTSSPAKKLHVEGAARIDNNAGNIQFVGTDHAYLEFYPRTISSGRKAYLGYAAHSTTNFTIMNQDTGGFIIGTNNSEKLRITSTGNVGIGTSNPGYKLHVNGYAAAHRFTDSDNASFYLEPGSGATGQWKVQTPSGYVSIGPNNTSWAHFYTDRSNGYYFDKRIVADTGIFGSYNEDLTLQAPYNTTRMTINSSTGNVGIGTTNPSAKVHASDGGTVPSLDAGTIFLASNTSGTGDYSSMSIISGTSGIASLFFGDTDTEKRGAVRYLNSSDALRFRTANTDRFSIKSNGFVGINTTDPGYQLDVDGEARVGSTNRENTRLLIQAENTAGAPATTTEIRMLGYESRAQGIFFQDSGNSGEEWFAGLNYSGSWDKYSIGYDASGGQGEYLANAILTVKGTVARVGVKNHDPQADMDVNGTIRATGGTFTSGTSGADSQSSAGIVLRRGRRILSGIPSNSNEDFYLRNLLEHTSSNSIIIGQGGTALISDIALKPGSNGNITFFGSGSEDMRVDSSGNVGIGTSYNPSGYKVNVNGDIGATTGSQLHMFQNGGTGSTNAVIRVTNLDTSNYGQTTPNIYSDSGNYYGNRHCEFATNGTVRGWIGHNGSTTVTYSTTSSDERLKKNIEVWDEDTLNKFRNIQPKKFNFVDQEDTDPKDKGYIAQNMVDSFPEAYPHDYSISQTEGMYSFNPSGMVVYLMKAVKDLIAENDNLKARVEALENA